MRAISGWFLILQGLTAATPAFSAEVRSFSNSSGGCLWTCTNGASGNTPDGVTVSTQKCVEMATGSCGNMGLTVQNCTNAGMRLISNGVRSAMAPGGFSAPKAVVAPMKNGAGK